MCLRGVPAKWQRKGLENYQYIYFLIPYNYKSPILIISIHYRIKVNYLNYFIFLVPMYYSLFYQHNNNVLRRFNDNTKCIVK